MRPSLYLLLLLLGTQTRAAAQTAQAAVRGTVLKAGTSEPIAEAQVTLSPVSTGAGLDSLTNLARALGAPPGALQGFIREMEQMSPEELRNEIEDQRDAPPEVLTFLTQLLTSKRLGQNLPARVRTDTDGHFSIPNLPPGDYKISVEHEGFFGTDPEGPLTLPSIATARVHVDAQQTGSGVTVEMIPGGRISGQARDGNGRALVNVDIRAFKVTYQNGRRTLQTAAQGLTDDRGAYRLYWLEPGEYRIALMGRKTAAAAGSVSGPILTRTFHPNTTDYAAAVPVPVHAGDDLAGVDITARTEPAFKISGRVIKTLPAPDNSNNRDAPENTPSFVTLMPHNSDIADEEFAMTALRRGNVNASTGQFEITGVPAGDYDLYGRFKGSFGENAGQPESSLGMARVSVNDQDVAGLTVVLHPPVEVKGKVTVDSAAPSAETVLIGLQPRSMSAVMVYGEAGEPQTAKPDGSIVIPGILQGSYMVRVFGLSGESYVEDIRQNGRSIYTSGLEIDGPPEPIEISIRTDGGGVAGVVSNAEGQPAPHVTVVLVPDPGQRQNSERYRTTTSDGQGHFSITAIAPGEYKVFSWERIPEGAYENAEFIAEYESRGKAVRVMSAETTETGVAVISPRDK